VRQNTTEPRQAPAGGRARTLGVCGTAMDVSAAIEKGGIVARPLKLLDHTCYSAKAVVSVGTNSAPVGTVRLELSNASPIGAKRPPRFSAKKISAMA